MRSKAFRVTNYKLIEDSGRVEIDPNVTCLMGKNEAGKTAVLQALWKFKNVADVSYDKLFDLPAEHYVDMRHNNPQVVEIEYFLENTDIEEFSATFPIVSTPPDTVTVRSNYEGDPSIEFDLHFELDTYSSISTMVNAAIKKLDVINEGIKKSTPQAPTEATEGGTEAPSAQNIGNPTIESALVALKDLASVGDGDKPATEFSSEIIARAVSALGAVQGEQLWDGVQEISNRLELFALHSKSKDLEKRVEKWVLDRIPIFIYFDDYGRLRTRIHLPEFINRKQTPHPDPEIMSLVRTQSALFEWAKLDPAEIRKLGVPKAESETQEVVERRKAERDRILESASYYLTGDWIDWWDQRVHQLDFTADGDDLELRVFDNINPWKIPFGERSAGFQWFFSFYLNFLVESEKTHRGAILLLDDPGLYLHPTAQLKLLKFFQKISSKNQIVYTSHSLFMVDPDHVDNVRTVYLKPDDPDNKMSRAYTKVSPSSEPEGDFETLMPMQAAGAYQLAQTIFLGKRTLIVEGITDYWLLKTLSNYLNDQTGEGLQKDTVIIWSGGTTYLMPLASVMASREQVGPNRLVVLLDSDRIGISKAKNLIELLVHGSDAVLLYGDILSISAAEVEDIADAKELIGALKTTGRIPTGSPRPRNQETNVPFLKRVFSDNGWDNLTNPDKATIILALVDSWRSGTTKPSDDTLERAKKIFQAVNQSFERIGADV